MADYCQLTLHTFPSGQIVWLKCLTATAQFYGWLDAFPNSEEGDSNASTHREFVTYPSRRFMPSVGGRKLRIYRSPVRQGYPKGQTNRFRVSRKIRNRQLAELAAFTKVEWHYMETAHGVRQPRDWWLELYHLGKAPWPAHQRK